VVGSATLAEDLPVPPIPPERPPLAEIAPVPNADARGPVAVPSHSPSIDVRFYRADLHDPALGFAPGSRYQINEDRKPLQTGVSVTVPLQ
jgi:hypothetical protein